MSPSGKGQIAAAASASTTPTSCATDSLMEKEPGQQKSRGRVREPITRRWRAVPFGPRAGKQRSPGHPGHRPPPPSPREKNPPTTTSPRADQPDDEGDHHRIEENHRPIVAPDARVDGSRT